MGHEMPGGVAAGLRTDNVMWQIVLEPTTEISRRGECAQRRELAERILREPTIKKMWAPHNTVYDMFVHWSGLGRAQGLVMLHA